MTALEEMGATLEDLACLPAEHGYSRSRPFLVALANGNKVLVTFDCVISGTDTNCMFAHVNEIRVCDEDIHVEIFHTELVASSDFVQEAPYPWTQYWEELNGIYDNFSQNGMDSLMRKGAYRMMFGAYQAVSQYLRAYYANT